MLLARAATFLAFVPITFGGQFSLEASANVPAPDGRIRVTENSGICETSNGVYSASGYGDLDSNSHMWFWFFEARNNPDTAPFAVWFNGGVSSKNTAPCFITNDSSRVDINPSSWNDVANIMYIDQPIGVGFSYGDATVGSSRDAAVAVWNFLQIFFADSRFGKYTTHDFAIWTESYGGHYGPTFAAYFLDQNAAILAGTIQGLPINLKVLGIGSGMTDPLSQYPGYISYAKSNPYHPLVPDYTINSVNDSYYSHGGCRDQLIACNKNFDDVTCSDAQSECNDKLLWILPGNYNPPAVTSAIGAEVTWTPESNQIYINFAKTGDWMKSSKQLLEKVIDAGVRTVLYDGDADYICNYMGVEAMLAGLNTSLSAEYLSQSWTQWKVNGTVAGQYKNAGTLSYIRIIGAGHLVPAYTVADLPRGLHALTIFRQANAGLPISST